MDEVLAVEHDGKTYAMTPTTLIDELIYSNYAYNRQRSPAITPEGWSTVFPTWQTLEARYQQEVTTRKGT